MLNYYYQTHDVIGKNLKKKLNKLPIEQQNEIVAFEKVEGFLKTPICLLH